MIVTPLILACLLQVTPPVATPAPAPRPDPATLGPKVGDSLPALSATDSEGTRRTFSSLKGPKGLVLVLFRSADW